MTQAGPSLETVGYLLKQVSVALRASLDSALRPLGLTMPQYVCLEVLAERPGISGAELARGAFVTRQTMHELLRGLEQRGWVERSAGRGRAQAAALTAEGRAAVQAADAVVRRIDTAMVAPLSEDQEEGLREALATCLRGLAAAT